MKHNITKFTQIREAVFLVFATLTIGFIIFILTNERYFAISLLTLLIFCAMIFIRLKWEKPAIMRYFENKSISFSIFVSLIILYLVTSGLTRFDYEEKIAFFFFQDISAVFQFSNISYPFALLTAFIFPLCLIATKFLKKNATEFCISLIILEILLLLTFGTRDLFCFYICFESILIPMFMMIGYWGSRERKIKAAYYFFLYTLFGSLFLLFGVIYIYILTNSTHFDIIFKWNFSFWEQIIIFICFFIGFAVKIPMFPFHIWLPEAHVEAPTIGSVILASILLKLGGYGFLLLIEIAPTAITFFIPLINTLATLGIIYTSMTAIRQIDLKRIIAYSSVAHMNLVVLGIFSGNSYGVVGAIYLMIAHGVTSAALFFCVGVLYDRYHTRLLKYYGGLVQVMPIFSIIFFIFTLANMGFPGTANFVGEFLTLVGVFEYDSFILVFAATSIILSSIYSIWLYNRIIFGTLKTIYISNFSDINVLELLIFIPLIISVLMLGIRSDFIINLIFDVNFNSWQQRSPEWKQMYNI